MQFLFSHSVEIDIDTRPTFHVADLAASPLSYAGCCCVNYRIFWTGQIRLVSEERSQRFTCQSHEQTKLHGARASRRPCAAQTDPLSAVPCCRSAAHVHMHISESTTQSQRNVSYKDFGWKPIWLQTYATLKFPSYKNGYMLEFSKTFS